MTRLNVAFASAEVTPFAKTGGLGDVTAALARHLTRAGHDVRVFLPLYQTTDTGSVELVPVDFAQNVTIHLGPRAVEYSLFTAPLGDDGPDAYFVHCPELYARDGLYTSGPDEHLRFLLLNRASIASCQRMGWSPHVFHCHDWHAALIPLYLRTIYAWDQLFHRTRTLLTIHNLGYQGVFGAEIADHIDLREFTYRLHQDDLRAGRVNFLKTGIISVDALTTVSRTYAQEIQTEAQGFGLHEELRHRRSDLIGIVNGIDDDVWDPSRDPRIPFHYGPDDLGGKARNKAHLLSELGLEPTEEAPLYGIVSRLVHQKGIDLLQETLPSFVGRNDVRIAVLGSGEPGYESFFMELQAAFPGRVCFYRGFSAKLAAMIEAGADMFVMPSLYEPCGLNQMYSLRYGTIPIVRRTGGLADTVTLYRSRTGEGTGIVFDHYTADGLSWAMTTGLDLHRTPHWERIVRNAMAEDFSWTRQGRIYEEVYAHLTGIARDG